MTRAVIAALLVASAGALAATVGASVRGGIDVVPCETAIDQARHPLLTAGSRVTLGRIVLPRRTVRLDPPKSGWDRFGKVGIDVRAGTPVVLEVPRAWRGVYALEYAPGQRDVRRVSDGSVRVSVHSCAGALGTWNSYAGGYLVERPHCVPLIIRANGRTATVHIAIGRSCAAAATGS